MKFKYSILIKNGQRSGWWCVFALAIMSSASLANAQTTLTFQEGLDGYTGTLDVFIDAGSTGTNIVGSSVQSAEIDGIFDGIFTLFEEKQMLVRFDNIIGNGVGQIPAGSKITNADLILTSSGQFVNIRGPHSVAQLLTPFDSSSTWSSLNSGVSFAQDDITRPHDNPFWDSNFELDGTAVDAEVTRFVQSWADGATNHGFAVYGAIEDEWHMYTSGSSFVDERPLLELDFCKVGNQGQWGLESECFLRISMAIPHGSQRSIIVVVLNATSKSSANSCISQLHRIEMPCCEPC